MMSEQIGEFRSFNREVTRRLGVLTEDFLGRGRPYGEARLIYEIGIDGADVRELRARLNLDSGYLSRLLRALERQELVQSSRASHDARVTTVALTSHGLTELQEINSRSDAFAESLLGRLNERQRTRLVEAATEVKRLLRAASVQVSPVSARSAAARWCLAQYFRDIGQRFEAGFDPDQSVTATPEELTPPSGYFLLASLDGNPIGCGALKVAGDCGEIKRMWVAESARGLGIGRRILDTLEAVARKAGVSLLQLDSNATLTEALKLYRTAGYVEVPAFNDNPYAQHWFEKRLTAGVAAS
jgi:DNA-binding MarR family transcriptional regulator/GNAT superfamily N-acetyltransferase